MQAMCRGALGSVADMYPASPALDPGGDTVSYSIEGGNEAGLFYIDAASGELFYTGTGEDYESDATRYELTVRVPFSGLDFKAPSTEHPRQIQATR